MKIVIAKMSGFCMGVRRAVEMVLDAPSRHPGPICTYGPLIHNPQVLDLLAAKDIATIRDIPACGTGTVLIRAHGVPPETKKRLRERATRSSTRPVRAWSASSPSSANTPVRTMP